MAGFRKRVAVKKWKRCFVGSSDPQALLIIIFSFAAVAPGYQAQRLQQGEALQDASEMIAVSCDPI